MSIMMSIIIAPTLPPPPSPASTLLLPGLLDVFRPYYLGDTLLCLLTNHETVLSRIALGKSAFTTTTRWSLPQVCKIPYADDDDDVSNTAQQLSSTRWSTWSLRGVRLYDSYYDSISISIIAELIELPLLAVSARAAQLSVIATMSARLHTLVLDQSFHCPTLAIDPLTDHAGHTLILHDATGAPLLLPSNLTHLALLNHFNESIDDVCFPTSLTHLDLGATFNQRLPPITLAASLPRLTYFRLPDCYTAPLDGVTLPEGIIVWNANCYDKPLTNWHPPASLTRIELVAYDHPLVGVMLPPRLTDLTLLVYNHSFTGVYFPSTLQRLYLFKFDQSVSGYGEFDIAHLTFLSHIDFGQKFNQPLYGVVWPPNLTSITLGQQFNQPLVGGAGGGVRLPDSLIQLNLLDCWRFTHSLQGMHWPPHLHTLYLYGKEDTLVGMGDWSASLTFLGLGFAANYVLHSWRGVVLPPALRTLQLDFRYAYGAALRMELERPASLTKLMMGPTAVKHYVAAQRKYMKQYKQARSQARARVVWVSASSAIGGGGSGGGGIDYGVSHPLSSPAALLAKVTVPHSDQYDHDNAGNANNADIDGDIDVGGIGIASVLWVEIQHASDSLRVRAVVEDEHFINRLSDSDATIYFNVEPLGVDRAEVMSVLQAAAAAVQREAKIGDEGLHQQQQPQQLRINYVDYRIL
jgi:hypothetical protein